MTQLIMASDYACMGRYPVQASAMFLNELSISPSLCSLDPELYRVIFHSELGSIWTIILNKCVTAVFCQQQISHKLEQNII